MTAAIFMAAFLLSINMEFVLHSTFVLAEPLLSLLTLLAWFVMVKALQQPERLSTWLIAGVLSGLTYLTKGTGLLIVFCFMFTATLLHSPQLWVKRVFWAYSGAFAAVSLPLWIYNWLAFGSPIYNFAMRNVMWMDSAEEKYIADAAELPTAQTFFQTNNLADIWARWWDGLAGMRFSFAKLLWPTRSLTFDDFLLAGGLDLVLILAVLGLLVTWSSLKPMLLRRRASLLLTASLFGVYYALFGWYLPGALLPIRFLIPLAPILFLFLAAGLVHALTTLFTNPELPRWSKAGVAIVVAALMLWIGGWFVRTGIANAQAFGKNPFAADAEFNAYNEQALLWVKTGHNRDSRITVLWGPTHNLPIWRQTDTLRFVRTPLSAANREGLEAFMAAQEVTYIVIDDDMARRRRSLAANLGLERSGGELLNVGDFPPDWALGLTAPGMPCRWCVFRRLNGPPAITPTDYLLAGDAIRLLGYEIDAQQFWPGGQLSLTLYWEALQPLAVDYTIFTQLLGPDFQLHGQLDRQPLSGFFPTTRWGPAQKFADKFVIDIGQVAPPGEYTLLVGLYNLNSGERATATHHNRPLPNSAIPLLQLYMKP